MQIQDLAIWLVAAALIIHTIAEVWIVEYLKVQPNWQAVVFDRLLFLENLPVFIFAIATAIAGWKLPIVGGILPAVGLTHPLIVKISYRFSHKGVASLLFWRLCLSPYAYRSRLGAGCTHSDN